MILFTLQSPHHATASERETMSTSRLLGHQSPSPISNAYLQTISHNRTRKRIAMRLPCVGNRRADVLGTRRMVRALRYIPIRFTVRCFTEQVSGLDPEGHQPDLSTTVLYHWDFSKPVGNIRVFFPRESQLRQSRATQPTVHAGCLSVCLIHRTLTRTTGSLSCVCDFFFFFLRTYMHEASVYSLFRRTFGGV